MDQGAIILFVKYPEPGRVKSRIGKVLGENMSADFYRSFVADILTKLKSLWVPFFCFYSPADKQKEIREWLGGDVALYAQEGEELGERMKNAFLKGFDLGYKSIALIGSDIPQINQAYFKKALEDLDKQEVIIGPALDGGYYLIGFRKDSFLPEVFTGIRWSMPDVLQKTLAILKAHHRETAMLPIFSDIDTAEDLMRILNSREKANMPETVKLAEKYGIITKGGFTAV